MSTFMFFLFHFFIFLGLVGVTSNITPSFACLSLVVMAGGVCGVLTYQGGCFLALILFLIYLGGMLVVFSYCVAFVMGVGSEDWGDLSVVFTFFIYIISLCLGFLYFVDIKLKGFWAEGVDCSGYEFIWEGQVGVSFLYSSGAPLLLVGCCVLLLVLLVVTELVKGRLLNSIRKV